MRLRLRVEIQGSVQGVGFRPFVHRLATELRLAGWVANDTRGVIVEAEGERGDLERLLDRLSREKPSPASIHELAASWCPAEGDREFRIEVSRPEGARTVQVLPDLATCEPCRAETGDPSDRRYRYPFTNCTYCGPRLSIVRSLPYDRPRTTMAGFTMCAACRGEYDDPGDRRFHAQPNACPVCGPRLALLDRRGTGLAEGEEALAGALEALRRGGIVALKGIGGFQLLVDAADGEAVTRLRGGKLRRDKPLALLVRDLPAVRRLCAVNAEEETLLAGPGAPIVLLRRRPGIPVHEAVAPGNPYLGIMLPCSPLHHLIAEGTDVPLVATSGNLSDEPICTDERDAVRRLGDMADRLLVHDRPIARHVDDSVFMVAAGAPRPLRRARGFAPRPVMTAREMPAILAVGAHLKNVVALGVGRQVVVSQHIGDMETPEARAAFEQVVADLLALYEASPVAVAHDLHPDYVTTRWAADAISARGDGGAPDVLRGLPLVPVQHHHAHLAACLADAGHEGEALGVTWDGTGYGEDGTIWGGELLLGDAGSYRRVGALRSFSLPGGEAAVREPRRSALGLLWEILGDEALGRDDLAPVRAFAAAERRVLAAMMARGVQAPTTTSAGRLFDGVAALAGLHPRAAFEGQAAMALEFAVDAGERGAYPLEPVSGPPTGPDWTLDWEPLLRAILDDLRRGTDASTIAARFHNALVHSLVATAVRVGTATVALTGGCFQNRRLLEGARDALVRAGFEVLLHAQVPANDGGIGLGQVAVAAARLADGSGVRGDVPSAVRPVHAT